MTEKSTATASATRATIASRIARINNITTQAIADRIRRVTDDSLEEPTPDNPSLFDNMMMIDRLPAKDRAEFLEKCPPAQQALIKRARRAFSKLIDLYFQEGSFSKSIIFIERHKQPDIRLYLHRRLFQLRQLQKIFAEKIVSSSKGLPTEMGPDKTMNMTLGPDKTMNMTLRAMRIVRKISGNKVNFVSPESIGYCLIHVPLCIAAEKMSPASKRRPSHKRLPPDVTKAACPPPRSRLSGRAR